MSRRAFSEADVAAREKGLPAGPGFRTFAEDRSASVTARIAPNGANGCGSGPVLFKELHMMRSERIHPVGVLVTAVAFASSALACSDGGKSPAAPRAGFTDPSFTLASGFVSGLIGRGNLGAFHIQSKHAGYHVELKSHDNTDIAVANVAIAPHGHSGWHYHPGPVVVVVKTGAITFYHASDPNCSGERHMAGSAFVEQGGAIGIARNEGEVEATAVATFFVPAGSATRFDAAVPANCSP